MKRKIGQSTTETLIGFVVMMLFLGGVFNIWIWANKQIVKRQQLYNASRKAAGTTSDQYKLEDYWPLERAESLKEEKVLLDTSR